jgi:hypothetical protein
MPAGEQIVTTPAVERRLKTDRAARRKLKA